MTVVSDTTFLEEKNKPENRPLHLFEVYYTDSDLLRLTDFDSDLTFDGNSYRAFDISYEDTGENIRLSVDTVTIRMGNVSREMQAYLELYDGLRGHSFNIKHVWYNQLSDAVCFMEESYYVDTAESNEEFIEFTLSSKFDVLNVQLPLRTYDRQHCYWKFVTDGSSDCGYSDAGLGDWCDHTFNRCKVLENTLRFGGFPSIPDNTFYGL